MQHSEIEEKSDFSQIRYAQLWEDADVLTQALGDCAGGTLVSICAAGDNALAMLTLDPAKVVVVDLSPAQIACLKLRIGAFRNLSHSEFLALMGARPSRNRKALLLRALADADADTRAVWTRLAKDVEAYGAGALGNLNAISEFSAPDFFLSFTRRKPSTTRLCPARNRRAKHSSITGSTHGAGGSCSMSFSRGS